MGLPEYTYCTFCGGPLQGYEIMDPQEYLHEEDMADDYDRSLLDTAELKWLDSFIMLGRKSFQVEPLSGGTGYIGLGVRDANWDKARQASDIWGYCSDDTPDEAQYALHLTCLRIAERVFRFLVFDDIQSSVQVARSQYSSRREELISSRTVINAIFDSLSTVYHRIVSGDRFDCSHGPIWDHGYYGMNQFWGYNDYWRGERGWEWYLDDPLHIPDLTTYILSHLLTRTRDSESPPLLESAELKIPSAALSSFEKLHIDVLREITSHLPAQAILNLLTSSKTLRSKFTLDQLFWRDQLISGGLISWLWDLDCAQCHSKDAEMRDKDEQWDWKRLAKMLASEAIVERAIACSDDIREARQGEGARIDWPDGEMVNLPKGLANRCRIVKIVEDLRKLETCERE